MPPPRKRIYHHFAFARVEPSRYAEAYRPLPKIDVCATLFDNDDIRPHPWWPLICKQTGLAAFKTEKELKAWFGSFCMDSNIAKIWPCNVCLLLHADTYPKEITGSSSGKSLRRDHAKAKKKKA